MPGTPHDEAPMLKTCGVSSKSTETGTRSVRGRSRRAPGPRRRSRAGRPRRPVCTSMKPPAPKPGQRALRRKRGQHRADGGVDRVSTLAAEPRPPPRRSAGCPAATRRRSTNRRAVGVELGGVDAEVAAAPRTGPRAAGARRGSRRGPALDGRSSRRRRAGRARRSGSRSRSPRSARRAPRRRWRRR